MHAILKKMHMHPCMRAFATVQKLLCHGSYCELILSLARASCRLLFAARSATVYKKSVARRCLFKKYIQIYASSWLRSSLRCRRSILRSSAWMQASSSFPVYTHLYAGLKSLQCTYTVYLVITALSFPPTYRLQTMFRLGRHWNTSTHHTLHVASSSTRVPCSEVDRGWGRNHRREPLGQPWAGQQFGAN